MQVGKRCGQPTVHLFRPRRAHVAGAQAGFHVAHRDAGMERGQRRRQRGAGVAVDQHHPRPAARQHVLHAGQHAGGDPGQVLAGTHQVEVVVGDDVEQLEHLVEHLPVLRSDADTDPQAAMLAQRMQDRGHLDGFRAGAEYQHHVECSRHARILAQRRQRRRASPYNARMPLLHFQRVDYGVGGPLLLEHVDLTIQPGERVCIVGRNGAGKSTLMRLMAGELKPDDGEVRVQAGVVVARMAQEVPQATQGSVFDVVAEGLGDLGQLLARYHHAVHDGDMAALADAQTAIEARDGWDIDRRVAQVLERLGLPEDADFAALSGGMKRRVLLAQALVRAPDILLLDEPTNHLDIEAIDWLEGFLKGWSGALVFVTHDRRFLRALATRIVEIDRGQVTSWPGDWDNYLRRKEERLNAEAQENARFDKLLAQEEVWIRQGIKARRTRNEGRVRALKALRRERAERRELAGKVKMEAAGAQASGKKVIEMAGVSHAFGDRVILREASATILRGDRIGIIGANGSGKSTLLNLLGELTPDAGKVELGTNLQIAYFDQHRSQLDEARSALENVAGGSDYVEINGSRKHVIGYLQDFLFTPERARAPITRLSGGERARLLLAKLFSKPANLLVLDEPTNDLDVETLELLEEVLLGFQGTVLMVSHDRAFLDNVVTSTLVLEGDGELGDYVGGYSDWLRQRPIPADNAPTPSLPNATPPAPSPALPAAAKKKLGYKDQRELDALPARIERLEADIAARTEAMQESAFYTQDAAARQRATAELAAFQAELDAAYARWEALDG